MAANAHTKKVEPQDNGVEPMLHVSFAAEDEQRKIELSLLSTSQGAARSAAVRDKMAADKAQAAREAKKLKRVKEFRRNKMARAGEADRHGTASLPKWLIAGKRGNGQTRSR